MALNFFIYALALHFGTEKANIVTSLRRLQDEMFYMFRWIVLNMMGWWWGNNGNNVGTTANKSCCGRLPIYSRPPRFLKLKPNTPVFLKWNILQVCDTFQKNICSNESLSNPVILVNIKYSSFFYSHLWNSFSKMHAPKTETWSLHFTAKQREEWAPLIAFILSWNPLVCCQARSKIPLNSQI